MCAQHYPWGHCLSAQHYWCFGAELILCGGAHPVHCRMLSCGLNLYVSDVNSSLPVCDNRYPQTLPSIPRLVWVQKSLLVKDSTKNTSLAWASNSGILMEPRYFEWQAEDQQLSQPAAWVSVSEHHIQPSTLLRTFVYVTDIEIRMKENNSW